MKTICRRNCKNCSRLFDDPPYPEPWPRGYCSAHCWKEWKKPAKVPETPRAPLRASGVGERPRRAVSTASAAQRQAVKDRGCLVCAAQPVHPAHLLDRSLAGDGHGDPRAVVPLCPTHHRAYDEAGDGQVLDLLPHLEPHFRAELGFAVERHGLLRTVERVTGCRVVLVPRDDERKDPR